MKGSSSSRGVATTFFMVSSPVSRCDSLFLDLIRPALRSALPVEEREDGASEVRREEHVVVRDIGQNRESVLRHVLTLPARVLEAAAEQLIKLHDVLGTGHVGVTVHQHNGHGELLHVL